MIKHKETVYVFDISNISQYLLMTYKEIDQELLSRIVKFVTHYVLIEYYGYSCSYEEYELDKVAFRNYGFNLRDRRLVKHMIEMWESQFFKYFTGVLREHVDKEVIIEYKCHNLAIRIPA